MKPNSDDIESLRRCIRDLVALSTLPALWTGADTGGIVESLAEVLQHILTLDFIYVRTNGEADAGPLEVVHTWNGAELPSRAREIGSVLDPWLHDRDRSAVPNPAGDGMVRLAVLPIGHDQGMFAAGSNRPDFPTENERLLMEVAGNQAAIVFQRRETEERLRGSEQRFTRFMQHLPGLAWIKDDRGRYVYANDAAVKAFRVRREELIGRTDDEIFLPKTAAQFRENDRDALASRAGVQVIETLEHEDGTLHHSLVSKFPITRPDGGAGLVGGMAIDITDRLRAEEALKEADRRKDEFLAMLAHELRNPLAPISNAVELLDFPEAPAELQWAREVIDRQVRQMTRLVDDLLDVSRITRGKIELRREHVRLATIVNNAVEASRPLIEECGHELTVDLPPEPIGLDADPTRLAQALSNLLNNAAKYTERGGRIRLAARTEGDRALIEVTDTGVGIPAEMLPRIFEMFVQVDRSLERSRGGLGIGLTLVQRLITMHGGTVEARSAGAGQGSTFTIRLPIASESVERQPGQSLDGDARHVPSATRRILIVDDNRDAADSLGALLRRAGNEVRMAYDGIEALDLAASFHPDVILLDIGLPKLNGYEVAARIREGERNGRTMLIALTGWGQEDDRRRSREAGFDHHLTKPVEFETLQRILA